MGVGWRRWQWQEPPNNTAYVKLQVTAASKGLSSRQGAFPVHCSCWYAGMEGAGNRSEQLEGAEATGTTSKGNRNQSVRDSNAAKEKGKTPWEKATARVWQAIGLGTRRMLSFTGRVVAIKAEQSIHWNCSSDTAADSKSEERNTCIFLES